MPKQSKDKAKHTPSPVPVPVTQGETAPAITNFHGPHFFLSNFCPSPIELDGETYPTVEHAFQALKTSDADDRRAIREAETAARAKQLGRRVNLRADWERVKFGLMADLLRQKFADPDLRASLLATGEADLIEGNTWGDKVWGCVQVKGKWIGQNNLGKLLMQVRAELKRIE